MIIFNPTTSPAVKEFSIRKLVAGGIASQYFGNSVSIASWGDAWIFKGLVKFLEYEINNESDNEFPSSELFISEVFHPTLQRKSLPSKFPLSTEVAISKEVAERGETCGTI